MDKHERPNILTGWDSIFLKSYFAVELRCHQWIQITKETAVCLKNVTTYFQTNCSFNYTSCACFVSWRDYYVDTHPSLLLFVARRNIEYGGNVSGRVVKGGRYLMIIGQDESTYHQWTFSKNHWKAQHV